jgi:predicted nuclease with TOPRIM domain
MGIEDSKLSPLQRENRKLRDNIDILEARIEELESLTEVADGIIQSLDEELCFLAGAVCELTEYLTNTSDPKAYALVRAFFTVIEQGAPTFHEAIKLAERMETDDGTT